MLAVDHRNDIDQAVWLQLTRRIARDEQVTLDVAEEIMSEALDFLQSCIELPGEAHTPSERADIGWHTFILYTKEYHGWCMQHAGYFLHHSPLPIEIEHTAEGDPICVNNCQCDPTPGKCCNFPDP